MMYLLIGRKIDMDEKELFIKNLLDNYSVIKEEFMANRDDEKSFALPDFADPTVHLEHWRTYYLWSRFKTLKQFLKRFPKTAKIIENGPGKYTGGFLLLAPHSTVPTHTHYDWPGEHYVLHLPIVVPEGDIGFVIDGKTHRWVEGQFLAFHCNQPHGTFNNTDGVRVILGLIFDPSWKSVLEPYMAT